MIDINCGTPLYIQCKVLFWISIGERNGASIIFEKERACKKIY